MVALPTARTIGPQDATWFAPDRQTKRLLRVLSAQRRLFALMAMALILVEISTASAQEWTRFRGPNGSGVSSSHVPTSWTPDDYNWKTPLPGIGHSSPVVWGQRVYLQSADPETAAQHVLAIDTESGEIVWQQTFELHSYHIHARNSFASSTPAVDADHVYVSWSTPETASLLALTHDGEVAWKQELGGFDSQHGFGSSPMLYKDLVVLCLQQKKPDRDGPQTKDSRIVALDRETGELRWTTERLSEVASYSVPCIYSPQDGPDELITCSTAHGIYSLDPSNGHENWAIEVFTMRTVSSPVILEGLIFGSTGSGAGGNYVVAVHPGKTASIAYEVRKQAPYVPCVVGHHGLAFLWSDNGIVTCIRVADGKQEWQHRVGGNYSGSPIIAGDHLYCIDEDGVVVVLAATDNYHLVGRYPLGEASRSTPAVADGRIYLRTYSHLISLGDGNTNRQAGG